jgi:hypothetical protein
MYHEINTRFSNAAFLRSYLRAREFHTHTKLQAKFEFFFNLCALDAVLIGSKHFPNCQMSWTYSSHPVGTVSWRVCGYLHSPLTSSWRGATLGTERSLPFYLYVQDMFALHCVSRHTSRHVRVEELKRHSHYIEVVSPRIWTRLELFVILLSLFFF